MAGLGLPMLLAGAAQGFIGERGRQQDRQLRREDQEYRHRRGERQDDLALAGEVRAQRGEERTQGAYDRGVEEYEYKKKKRLTADEKERAENYFNVLGRWADATRNGNKTEADLLLPQLNKYKDKNQKGNFATTARVPMPEGGGESAGLMAVDDEGQPMTSDGRPIIMRDEDIKRIADEYLTRKGGPKEFAISGGYRVQTKGRGAGDLKRLKEKSKGFAASKFGIFSKDTGKYVPGQGSYAGAGGRMFTQQDQASIASQVRQLVDRAFGNKFDDVMGEYARPPNNPALAAEAMSYAVRAYMDGKYPNATTAAEQASVLAKKAGAAKMTLAQWLRKNAKKGKAGPGAPATAGELVNKHQPTQTAGGVGVPTSSAGIGRM